MLSWWKVARDWRKHEKNLAHGQIESKIVQFAKELSVTPLTVRRATSALRFAERLAHEKRIPSPNSVRLMPISHLHRLQRIDRFSSTESDHLLSMFFDRTLDSRSLTVAEQRLHALTGRPDKSARQADSHLRRMSVPHLVQQVLEAFKSTAYSGKPSLLRNSERDLIALHAIGRTGKGRTSCDYGVRVFVPGAKPLTPSRQKAIINYGLAVGRFLDSVFLVFADNDEAANISTIAKTLGPSGIGVCCIDNDGALQILLEPARQGQPDLDKSTRSWVQ
jgi:hypothetical protein